MVPTARAEQERLAVPLPGGLFGVWRRGAGRMVGRVCAVVCSAGRGRQVVSAPTQTLKVPAAIRPVFEEVVAVTDAFCVGHLDAEYAALCVKLAARLARKRPSPLARGDRRIWAAGIVYAVGRVNFLADPSQRPHLRTDELAELLGVKQSTMVNKGRLIMDTVRIGLLDPEFSRREMLENNPMVWLVQVDGLLVDARGLPEAVQVEAWRRGLIPYVPARAAGEREGGSSAG